MSDRARNITLFVLASMFGFGVFYTLAHEDITPPVVTDVVDGDTLVLDDGTTVRLARVDAPEWDEEGGEAATARLRQLTLTKSVQIQDDPKQPDEDKYGRRIAYVYVGDTNVNLALIDQGYATYWEP